MRNPIRQLAAAAGGALMKFGYDAVENRGRRKRTDPTTRSEDRELTQAERRELNSATRDLQRNFTIAAWAVRKHLDYVSSFKFQPNTGNPEFDDVLAAKMGEWGKAENCDVAGRHPLRRIIRMVEERRTVDGDVLVNFVGDGRLQVIEADRIRTPHGGSLPQGVDLQKFDHGVLTDDYGRAVAYAVCDRPRQSSDLRFRKLLSPAYAKLVGYYTRVDQVRGVSPLAPAVNTFRDIYENFDYALAKAKLCNFLGLVTTRDGDAELGVHDSEEGEDGEQRYNVDLGRGPIHLDLEPGDDAKILESGTPSTQFQAFAQEMIVAALKGLDIPGCFYDEGRANFSSGRQGWILYNQSALHKRDDLRDVLDFMTAWRIRLWVLAGELELPAGVALEDVRWEWIHAGIPWVDPLKEITADVMAVNSGMACRQDRLKEQGRDFFEIVDKLAEEMAYAKAKGVEFTETPWVGDVAAAAIAAGDDGGRGSKREGNDNGK